MQERSPPFEKRGVRRMAVLEQVAIFLGAAVVIVPLTKRAGFGSVLGYMLAGVIVGPWALDLVDDEQKILHFAEFGVVLLLFVIGLELQPRRLWTMRRAVFGLGGGQFALTAAALAGLALMFGLPLETAVVAGLALSLSSTAFALQALAERNELTARHGRLSFSILLFQDLAVIPILALLPLLAPASGAADDGILWLDIAKAVGMIALVVLGGRYLLRYVLRLIARFGTHEVFTATTLLTVVGGALLMELAGLSMALGAFLAGVLLADSEYRHELEADIEPFKGLLLGLFFMAVGISFKLSSDPEFIDKVRDIIGLYLDPPDRALVLCIDEKSQIQALDRTQPMLPMRPGQAERRSHDYKRHGTTTLFAALDTATGRGHRELHVKRHRAREFRSFLDEVESAVPADLDIHVVMDNASNHKTKLIQDWFAKRPHWHSHFTPTSASWINQVERFFALSTERQIKRGAHRLTAELEAAIQRYIETHNREPKPFRWTKSADAILASIQRFCQRTLSVHTEVG